MKTYGQWKLVSTSVANGFVWVCSECGFATIKKEDKCPECQSIMIDTVQDYVNSGKE